MLSNEVFHEVVDVADLTDGHFRLQYQKPNRAFYCKARPQTQHGTWGEWSEEQRILTLRDVYVHLEEVGETCITVQWYRPVTTGQNRDPDFMERDMLLKEFEVRYCSVSEHRCAMLLHLLLHQPLQL